MNVKKAIKKMVALGTGAALMGATVLGAMAADLSDFPEPFVKDGAFDAMIVIGSAAATADVVGAIDIATTLQYEMREMTAMGSGSSTTVTLSGDSVLIEKNKDKLAYGELISAVENSFDSEDLDVLRDEEFADEDYTQEITLGDGKGIVFAENEDDEVAHFLKYANGDTILTYELDFDSDVTDVASELADESIIMLGREYAIQTIEAATSGEIKISLLGGENSGLIAGVGAVEEFEGPGGNMYTVELIVTSESGDGKASIRVNNEQFSMEAGDTEELADGTIFGVEEVFHSESYPYVEFYLGADELVLEDTDVTDSASSKKLVVGDETYSNVAVTIEGASTAAADDSITLSKITLALSADDDYYIADGEKLSDYIDGTNEDYIFGNFDITFEGMTESAGNTIEMDASTDQYVLDFTTVKNVDYSLDYAYAKGVSLLKTGSSTNWINFNNTDAAAGVTNITIAPTDLVFEEDEVFLVTDSEADPEDRSGRFVSLDNVNVNVNEMEADLSFSDLAVGGQSWDITLTDEDGYALDGVLSDVLTIDGEDHVVMMSINDSLTHVYVDNMLATASPFAIGLPGESYIDFDQASAAANTVNLSVAVTQGAYDEDPGNDQYVRMFFDANADEEVTVNDAFTGGLAGVTLEDEDYDRQYTDFGVRITENTEDEDVEIFIPAAMSFAQVFLTSGDVTSNVVEGATGGSAYTISPVAAGVARLDTEVGTSYTRENVISVGGPCANTVSAALMGSPAVCGEEFEPGKALIRLVPQGSKVAMVVAGYEAAETRLATRVVHNFRANADKFVGTELEIAGTEMADVTITSVN